MNNKFDTGKVRGKNPKGFLDIIEHFIRTLD